MPAATGGRCPVDRQTTPAAVLDLTKSDRTRTPQPRALPPIEAVTEVSVCSRAAPQRPAGVHGYLAPARQPARAQPALIDRALAFSKLAGHARGRGHRPPADLTEPTDPDPGARARQPFLLICLNHPPFRPRRASHNPRAYRWNTRGEPHAAVTNAQNTQLCATAPRHTYCRYEAHSRRSARLLSPVLTWRAAIPTIRCDCA
jgi:hypothetical protein